MEMHQVTTEDGYILMLHRIPYPKGQNSGPIGRPVLLQHGVIESSADWVLNPSEKSLGKLYRLTESPFIFQIGFPFCDNKPLL